MILTELPRTDEMGLLPIVKSDCGAAPRNHCLRWISGHTILESMETEKWKTTVCSDGEPNVQDTVGVGSTLTFQIQ